MPLILILLVLLVLSPVAAEDRVVAKVVGENFEIRFNDEFYTQLMADGKALSPFEPSDYLRLPGEENEITEFSVKRASTKPVEDEFGKGQETTIVGLADDLQKTLKVTVYPAFPEVATFRVSYQNVGQKSLTIAEWVNNGYRIPFQGDSDDLWSFQGGSYEDRYDWIRPLKVGEGEDNFQGMTFRENGLKKV